MRQSTANDLYLWNNNRPEILKDIHHIYFSNLRYVNVNFNFIVSVENLSMMYMPSLESISLSWNQITSMRNVRKANWPKLKRVSLNNNFVRSFSDFCEGKFIMLEEITFDDIYRSSELNIIDLRKVFTLESCTLENLNLHEVRFGLQHSLKGKFEGRWQVIDVYASDL